MLKFIRYLVIAVLLLASGSVSATHLMGGEITWECMGNGTYIFSMKLYRDCNGVNFSATSVNMEVHNHPSVSSITLNKTGDNDISPQCTGGGPSISCGGGGNGAVQELIFTSAPVTLSGVPPAQGWVYTFDSFARNNAITNLVSPGSKGFTLRAKMFPYTGLNTNPCFDSSPSFSTKPTTIVCAGVPFTYNQLAFDKDGDSLVYSWAQPLNNFSGAFTPTNPAALAFSGTYSFNSPYPNTTHNASNVPATLNSSTGEISFTSFTQGNFVNCIKVSAYKCGQLVAEVFREIQVIVLPCAVNAPPIATPPFVDGLGNPIFNDTVTAGELINFRYCAYDSPGQLLTLTVIGDQFGTNYANPNAGCQNAPCAILGPPPLPSISGTDSVCIFFQWQTACSHLQSSSGCAATSNTYQFLFTIQDDACPTAGLSIGTVSITIVPPPAIESPQIHCVAVIPSGDVILTWDTPIDTTASFNGYEIFHSTNPTGPFSSLALISTYNQTNYTHIGANGNSGPQYYYIQSLGCAQGTASSPIDTVSSIYLTASGVGNTVNLNWNSTHNPLLSSSSTWYRIYREQPIGIWTLIDSTQSLTYIDTISSCDSIISYRVEIDDGLPCTSLSSIDTVAMSGGSANFSDFTFSGTCFEDSTQFTYVNLGGNTIADYHWNFGDGDTSNLADPIHFYNSPGNYTVYVNSTTTSGCVDSISKTVVINPTPIINVTPDTTICQNSALQLNASGGNDYLWTPGGSLNNNAISNPIANPTSTTNYILTVTDTNGCQSNDSVLVSLFTLPIYDAGNDTAICLNDSVQLNASGGVTYNWFSSATLSDTTINNPWASPTTSTYYFVTITDANSCSFVDSVLVAVNSLPVIITSDASICIGDTAQLSASGANQYAWTPSATLNDTSIFNPLAFPNITTIYTVTGTDTNGCISNSSTTVTVNPLPIVDAGLDTTVCAGTALTLGGSPTGPSGSSYTWTPSVSLNDSTLANPVAIPTINPTEYIVTVTDTNGCISLDSVLISINPLPIIITNNDTSVCIGTCAQLNATGALSYSWSPGSSLSDSTIANPVACTTSSTTYIVTGTDVNGCIDTASTTITIDPLPIVDAGNDQAICFGDTIVIGGSPTGPVGASYSWIPSASLNDTTLANPNATPLVTTTYIVTVTDINGCIDVDTVTITVNPLPIVDAGLDTTVCAGTSLILGGSPTGPSGSSYSWTPSASLNDSTLANPTAIPTINPTDYIVTVTDTNGCMSMDSVLISINPLPIIITNNDTSVCIGTCAQLNATGAFSYSWSPGSSLSDSTIANPVACTTSSTTYIVTGTDVNGCIDTSSTTITIDPLPIVDAGNDQAICFGDTIVIGGSPTGPVGASYSWIPSASLNDTTLANPNATPLVTTTYIVTVTDVNGCIDVDTVTITVNPLPIVDAGLDTTVCAGTSLILGGSPTGPTGSSYSWTPSASLNDSTLANPTAIPTINPTEYIVTVTDSNGCMSMDSVLISINPLPIIITNNDTSVCIGTCAQLNATGAFSYSWSPGTSLSDSTFANPVACTTSSTTYIVTGTDVNGCIDTASTTITIDPLPIVDAGNDQTICFGDTIVIGGSPTGPVGASYSWIPSVSLNDTTLANPNATPLVTTTYIVTVTDINGCIDVDTVTITVNPLPIVDAGLDTSICIGDSIQINATGASSYLWTPNTNISNPIISNPFVFPIATTTYYVIGTDTNACTNMDSVIVTVNSLPVITNSNDTTICFGDCVQINASGGTNYLWTPGGSLSDSSLSNPIACPTGATTYNVTGTDVNGCVDTSSVTIGINPLPIIDAGPDLWLCSGDSIQLNVVGAVSYLWTPSLGLNDTTLFNPMASPLDSTIYLVTGIDTNGCSNTDTIQVIVNDEVPIDPGMNDTICAGDSIMLGGLPTSPNGTSFSWFPNGGTLDNDTLANPIAFPTVTTTYYVVATNDTCTAIDSITITVNQLPIINAGADIDICVGDSVQLNATGGISYLWQPGSLLSDSIISNPVGFLNDTTEFVVVGTDANGCSSNDIVIVNVNALPTILASGTAPNVCIGDTIQLNATGGISYLWSPALGLNDTTIANPLAFPLTTTTYIVTGTDANLCSNIDSITITINQLSITDLSDTIICIGEVLQLSVTGPSGATYLWTPATNLSSSTIFNPITSTSVNINYVVVVTDTNGCMDTTSILVSAEPKPTSDFSVEATPSCDGISVDFTNLSMGASSYLWNFNDGDQSTEINPTHIFTYGSSANVVLTSYSSGLCVDTSSHPITSGNFEDYFNLTPPTILTPNGDGINDLFRLDLPNDIDQCTNIQVFNRWGKKVYESNGQGNGWNGETSTGNKVPDGTYFYIIDINGFTKKGSLTLME